MKEQVMNGDVLIQNIINIFVMAIILEAAVMAVFSMSAFKRIAASRPVEATRDGIIILIAFYLCYKVQLFNLFHYTGIRMPHIVDVIISALVLTRMTNFIRSVMARLKNED